MEISTISLISIVTVLSLLLFWEHRKPFFGFFKEDTGHKLRHDGINLAIGVFNGLLVSLLFVSLWAVAAIWSESRGMGLLNWIFPDLPGYDILLQSVFTDTSALNTAGYLIFSRFLLAVLLLDLWMYIWHMMNHKIPILWRFHKLHHSDRQMDVTTASRFHVGEIVISSLLRVPVIVLLGVQLHELLVYELFMFAVVQFHHADIRLNDTVERVLSKIIVTPNVHKIHHSEWQPETDSNYGSMFVFWDKLFRTFRLRSDPSTIVFGIRESSHQKKKS